MRTLDLFAGSFSAAPLTMRTPPPRHSGAMSNPVHELQARAAAAQKPRSRRAPPPLPDDFDVERARDELRRRPFAHAMSSQRDWYEAITRRRVQFGWTQPDADEALLYDPESERGGRRHMSKIEPARHGSEKAYMRLVLKLITKPSFIKIMQGYGLMLLVVDEYSGDELIDHAAQPPVPPRTKAEARRKGIYSGQLDIEEWLAAGGWDQRRSRVRRAA